MATKTVIGRVQYPTGTEAEWTLANPVLLKNEEGRESDTGRRKIGDGVTPWKELPYCLAGETVPGLNWAVRGGNLCVKPNCDMNDPILKRCSIGILHYKNAKFRYYKASRKRRPVNVGFKVVDDNFAFSEIFWTNVRITPVPFDLSKADSVGWVPLISADDLCDRWVERQQDSSCYQNMGFKVHRGGSATQATIDKPGPIQMRASFYGGVVLFVEHPKGRIEGPRSYFRVMIDNRQFPIQPHIVHV